MENMMDFQAQHPHLSSCTPRTVSERLHIDMETPESIHTDPHEGNSGASHHPSSEFSIESVCVDPVSRAPPRVDSCPDMDTRPPLTQELTGMECDAHVDGALSGGTFHMQGLLSQLSNVDCQPGQLEMCHNSATSDRAAPIVPSEPHEGQAECLPCPLHVATGKGLAQALQRVSESRATLSNSMGLFLTDPNTENLLSLFQYEEAVVEGGSDTPLARLEAIPTNESCSTPLMQEQEEGGLEWGNVNVSYSELNKKDLTFNLAEVPKPVWTDPENPQKSDKETMEFPSNSLTLAKVPGPCDPEDLLDGVIFGAKYLGSTQLQCEKHPVASTRMRQAQEAVDRVKAPDGESQPMTEVDILVSTRRVKVLTADTQKILMDHTLQTISYTADIGCIVVLMTHRKPLRSQDQPLTNRRANRMLCHVFQSVDAQLIAQAIGQAFGLAYQNLLLSEGLEPSVSRSSQREEQLYNADLAHFSNSDNCKEVYIQKQRGEVLGVAVVESGWGSLLPTVVIANLMHGGPAERSGDISIGDHVTSVNGTSLVGLPLSTCQGLIRELKGQSEVILNIVRCPPVITAIIQRPSVNHQLGFCVENGVICSLVRGGIAERGGIRVGHRIIEINGQSVVATAHEKIIQTLLDATGEVHIKTMPASTYRLLTGQETPVYL